jgi:hypothetical protein
MAYCGEFTIGGAEYPELLIILERIMSGLNFSIGD